MAFSHTEPCERCVANGRDRRGDNLAVYRDGGAHCFSCGFHRHPVGRPISLGERVNAPKSVLPVDFTRDVPARAWEWLLQYGLGWKYWQPFIGWSEKDSRLVFTCGEPIAFSLGRFLGTEPTAKKWFAYGDCHARPEVFGYDRGTSCVLVEDLISAHKVGQCTTAIPLFGTRIFPSVVPALRHIGKPVVMWLDKDQDLYAAKRAAWLAMVTGLSVRYVSTEKDPKLQPLDKIEELCYDSRNGTQANDEDIERHHREGQGA